MRDAECIEFLRWALPRLGLRWSGFRKPRRQVCRRIAGRLATLGVTDLGRYRGRLQAEEIGCGEWEVLGSLCRVTISRFFRDRRVFETLGQQVLPRLGRALIAEGGSRLRAWSVGSASGEEPYSLRLLWHFELEPKLEIVDLEIVATEIDHHLLDRARRARYPAGCLREVPAAWRRRAFEEDLEAGEFLLRPAFRAGVEFRREDVRLASPPGRFDLVLCRNLAWTYFDDEVQRRVLARIAAALSPAGVLVVGGHEELPGGGESEARFELLERSIYRVTRTPDLGTDLF